MTLQDDAPPDALDAALRQQFHDGEEPDDAGFSLRVMGALPPQPARYRRHKSRVLRRAQWTAASVAACGAATLLAGAGSPPDVPRLVAALALMALLAFWSIPSRWNGS